MQTPETKLSSFTHEANEAQAQAAYKVGVEHAIRAENALTKAKKRPVEQSVDLRKMSRRRLWGWLFERRGEMEAWDMGGLPQG